MEVQTVLSLSLSLSPRDDLMRHLVVLLWYSYLPFLFCGCLPIVDKMGSL
jgi:hypothetical protein